MHYLDINIKILTINPALFAQCAMSSLLLFMTEYSCCNQHKCEEGTSVHITRFLLVHERGFAGTRGGKIFKVF